MKKLQSRLTNLEKMNPEGKKMIRSFYVMSGSHETFGYDVSYHGSYPEELRDKEHYMQLKNEPGIPTRLENVSEEEYQEYKKKYFEEDSDILQINLRGV